MRHAVATANVPPPVPALPAGLEVASHTLANGLRLLVQPDQ